MARIGVLQNHKHTRACSMTVCIFEQSQAVQRSYWGCSTSLTDVTYDVTEVMIDFTYDVTCMV